MSAENLDYYWEKYGDLDWEEPSVPNPHHRTFPKAPWYKVRIKNALQRNDICYRNGHHWKGHQYLHAFRALSTQGTPDRATIVWLSRRLKLSTLSSRDSNHRWEEIWRQDEENTALSISLSHFQWKPLFIGRREVARPEDPFMCGLFDDEGGKLMTLVQRVTRANRNEMVLWFCDGSKGKQRYDGVKGYERNSVKFGQLKDLFVFNEWSNYGRAVRDCHLDIAAVSISGGGTIFTLTYVPPKEVSIYLIDKFSQEAQKAVPALPGSIQVRINGPCPKVNEVVLMVKETFGC